jgi:hypothetical protein
MCESGPPGQPSAYVQAHGRLPVDGLQQLLPATARAADRRNPGVEATAVKSRQPGIIDGTCIFP